MSWTHQVRAFALGLVLLAFAGCRQQMPENTLLVSFRHPSDSFNYVDGLLFENGHLSASLVEFSKIRYPQLSLSFRRLSVEKIPNRAAWRIEVADDEGLRLRRLLDCMRSFLEVEWRAKLVDGVVKLYGQTLAARANEMPPDQANELSGWIRTKLDDVNNNAVVLVVLEPKASDQ